MPSERIAFSKKLRNEFATLDSSEINRFNSFSELFIISHKTVQSFLSDKVATFPKNILARKRGNNFYTPL